MSKDEKELLFVFQVTFYSCLLVAFALLLIETTSPGPLPDMTRAREIHAIYIELQDNTFSDETSELALRAWERFTLQKTTIDEWSK